MDKIKRFFQGVWTVLKTIWKYTVLTCLVLWIVTKFIYKVLKYICIGIKYTFKGIFIVLKYTCITIQYTWYVFLIILAFPLRLQIKDDDGLGTKTAKHIISIFVMSFIWVWLQYYGQAHNWHEYSDVLLWFVCWSVFSFLFPKTIMGILHDAFWWIFALIMAASYVGSRGK